MEPSDPTLRPLPDRVRPGLDVLLVGINPGLRSAALGHHFAGHGNRFWKLLHEAGLTSRVLSFEEDRLLPDAGIGLTNIVERPTRSSSDLLPEDFARGARTLERKVRRLRPRCVAFVGITAYRGFSRRRPGARQTGRVACGLQDDEIAGAAVFVLPNPSGRNAAYGYAEMLRHWRALRRWVAGG